MAHWTATMLCHKYAMMIQWIAWVCLAKCEFCRIIAAVTIQRTWQVFVSYTNYMFMVADIVIVHGLFQA